MNKRSRARPDCGKPIFDRNFCDSCAKFWSNTGELLPRPFATRFWRRPTKHDFDPVVCSQDTSLRDSGVAPQNMSLGEAFSPWKHWALPKREIFISGAFLGFMLANNYDQWLSLQDNCILLRHPGCNFWEALCTQNPPAEMTFDAFSFMPLFTTYRGRTNKNRNCRMSSELV